MCGRRSSRRGRWSRPASSTLEKANKLAEQARGKGKDGSLKKAFAGRPDIHVTEAGPFSWMNYGSVSPMSSYAPPELSQVEGIEKPGTGFMQEVFDLKENEVGVAMNQPKTVAYVIRLVEVSPPYTVRFDEFKTQPLNKYASLAIEDRYEASKAWQKELETSAGLTWERKPHEADERRSSAGRGPQSPELPDDDDL